jgi:outer membrane lipoprotein-sorting protein
MRGKTWINGSLALVTTMACLCLPTRAGTTNARPAGSGAEAVTSRLVTAAGELDVDAAVARFEDLYRSESSTSHAELEVIRPRRQRSLEMKIWTQGEEKALVVIEAPPREKGTATLRVGDNLWNYLPRIRRTIRIPPSMMLSSWMGSDFTNDDLVRESSYSKDYAYALKGRSQDPDGWVVAFTAKADTVGLWERFELVVSPDGSLPLQSRWYDRKGELARIITWSDIAVLDGKRLPTRMTLVPQDKDEEGHRTTMTYHSIDFDVEHPEGMFSLSYLERKR